MIERLLLFGALEDELVAEQAREDGAALGCDGFPQVRALFTHGANNLKPDARPDGRSACSLNIARTWPPGEGSLF